MLAAPRIAMNFDADIHVQRRMNCNNFSELLTLRKRHHQVKLLFVISPLQRTLLKKASHYMLKSAAKQTDAGCVPVKWLLPLKAYKGRNVIL